MCKIVNTLTKFDVAIFVQQVKFATGMVMTHKKYHYTCLIYGWDCVCEATDDWVQCMGVNRLRDKTQQPFYNVFVMDGSDRYAAEENLELASNPTLITHPEVSLIQ